MNNPEHKTTLNVISPTTGESIKQIQITSPNELQRITAKGKAAHANWKKLSISHRSALVSGFRKKLVSRMDDLIQCICDETGKKEFEGLLEVMISAEHMKHAAKISRKVLKRQYRNSGLLLHKRASVEYEPYGVAGIISPWNYPLILTLSPVVEALLAGNCVVLKPSEHTPLTAQLLKTIWNSLDVDPDVFQVIYGEGATGKDLVTSPDTDIICFTGSTRIGRMIAVDCAKLLKPVILELGGKDPMIVMNDANITRAVKAAVWGGMSNAGQTCISVERIYVQDTIYDAFCQKISGKIRNMSSGPGEDHLVGAITIPAGYQKIIRQLEELPSAVKLEQGYTDNPSKYIAPTLVFDPPENSQISREETFGPVISISSFHTTDDAIRLANSTGYGLSASVFTRDSHLARQISSALDCGSVVVNDVFTGYGVADLPFGGKGFSGSGRVHGREGLLAFSHSKSFTENRVTFPGEPWWYETSGKLGKVLRKFIRFWYG